MGRNPSERETLTVVEAARRLGIGRSFAYELAARGELPGAIRLGRRIVVARRALDRALVASNAAELIAPDNGPEAA